jgi:hypothetical protein
MLDLSHHYLTFLWFTGIYYKYLIVCPRASIQLPATKTPLLSHVSTFQLKMVLGEHRIYLTFLMYGIDLGFWFWQY